jgi:outer membrane lipopolysaccharide assembly protein LptE/RlpB
MKDMLVKCALLLAALGLAACGAAGEENPEVTTAASTAVVGSEAAASDVILTDEMALMLGTMKLDEVGLAPDAAQATRLLTLWQAYQSLTTSDTAASQELEAVMAQIRETMTTEQHAAIGAMDLDQEDLTVFMEAYREEAAASGESPFEGAFGMGGPGGDFVPPEGGSAPPAGGFGPRDGSGGGAFVSPDGAPGGGFGGEGSGMSPEMQATAQAGRGAGARNRGSLFLLRPLIAELQVLAGA